MDKCTSHELLLENLNLELYLEITMNLGMSVRVRSLQLADSPDEVHRMVWRVLQKNTQLFE